MDFGGFYFKFQTEDEARRVAGFLPRRLEHYVSRRETWFDNPNSDWAPYVERDGCYVLVPGTCEVSTLEYGYRDDVQKGESFFQQVSRHLAAADYYGDFSGQCSLRSEGHFGGESIACSYDGKALEFRLMTGWTRFCNSCASALAAADGAGRPEPELRVIRDNPVALLNPTESCIYKGDCNLDVRYQRWGRIKGGDFERLGEHDRWDEKAGAWRRVVVPPKEVVFNVRIGEKTYKLHG